KFPSWSPCPISWGSHAYENFHSCYTLRSRPCPMCKRSQCSMLSAKCPAKCDHRPHRSSCAVVPEGAPLLEYGNNYVRRIRKFLALRNALDSADGGIGDLAEEILA